MTKRSPTKKTKQTPDEAAENVIAIFGSDALIVEALAARLEITTTTLIHELIAKGLREFGQPLPPAIVKYLKAHGRPVPPTAKRDPKKHSLS
jgi:hypothetical protein